MSAHKLRRLATYHVVGSRARGRVTTSIVADSEVIMLCICMISCIRLEVFIYRTIEVSN